MSISRIAMVVVFATCIGCFQYMDNPARAEFATISGEVKLAEATRAASAELNEALSSFHKMLAAIETNNADLAKKWRDSTIQGLGKAIVGYKKGLKHAGQRDIDLNPNVKNESEANQVAYFFETLKKRDVKERSIKRVLGVVISIVEEFQQSVSSINIDDLMKNIEDQQALAFESTRMQNFLNSVTTIFRIG